MAASTSGTRVQTGPTELIILLAVAAAAWQQRALLARLAWEYVTARSPFVGQHPRVVLAGALAGLVALLVLLGGSLHSLRRGSLLVRRKECVDVLDLRADEIEWGARQVLGRRVVTLLSAPMGSGKGWAAWALLRAMQDGGEWFGITARRPWCRPKRWQWWRRPGPLGVLWATEESVSFARTAAQFGIRRGLVHVLRLEDVPTAERTWPLLLHRFRREARKHGCGYVFVDTIGAWCPAMEEGDAPQMVDDARRQLCHDGLGLLFFHHDARAGHPRGHGNLEGAIDTLVRLKPVPDQPKARRLIVTRRFGALDLTATLDGHRYVLDAATDAKTPNAAPTVPKHLVSTLDVLRGAGADGLTAAAVLAATGVPDATVSRRLVALEALGLVERSGAGVKGAANVWRVTTAAAPAATNPTADPAYLRYLNSPEWEAKKAGIRTRANGACEACGHPAAVLEVHHLSYAHWGHELPEELQALCRACHRKADTPPMPAALS